MDRFQNVYVADYGNNKIRLVTRAGILTTFAGTGVSGSSGDGGVAINAQLCQPQGVAVDITSGSVYIADTGNFKIRVVTRNGIISTFAGGIDCSQHGCPSYNLYDCATSSAYLYFPTAVAVDYLGNVYIGTGSPSGNSFGNQVLFIAHGTAYITLLAGCDTCSNGYGGSAISTGLNPVTGIAVDTHLNVYIATSTQYQSNNQVLLVSHSTGMISVFAGSNSWSSNNGDGGPAMSGQLRSPRGVGVDNDGNVYVTDLQNNNVRVVTNRTGIITTFAGGGGSYGDFGDDGPASSSFLNSPYGVAVDMQGNVFIADTNDYRIRKVSNINNNPTSQPTSWPSIPSSQPSLQPSSHPSHPTSQPSSLPSCPTLVPSGEPSIWQPKHEVADCRGCVVLCCVMYLSIKSVAC